MFPLPSDVIGEVLKRMDDKDVLHLLLASRMMKQTCCSTEEYARRKSNRPVCRATIVITKKDDESGLPHSVELDAFIKTDQFLYYKNRRIFDIHDFIRNSNRIGSQHHEEKELQNIIKLKRNAVFTTCISAYSPEPGRSCAFSWDTTSYWAPAKPIRILHNQIYTGFIDIKIHDL